MLTAKEFLTRPGHPGAAGQLLMDSIAIRFPSEFLHQAARTSPMVAMGRSIATLFQLQAEHLSVELDRGLDVRDRDDRGDVCVSEHVPSSLPSVRRDHVSQASADASVVVGRPDGYRSGENVV